jgi:hypothetical protein
MKKSVILFLCCVNVAFAYPAFKGSISPVPRYVQKKMRGVTMRENCPIGFNQLSYVRISFLDFNHRTHRGALIVNRRLAKQVLSMFRKLYYHRFPMRSVRPMYEFNGNDHASMEANNTSAFNCRKIGTSRRFSKHSYGEAIDINPLLNPYIRGQYVAPEGARAFISRSSYHPGKITRKSYVYKLFREYRWSWGGNWRYSKDYQHFEKNDRG